MDPYLESPLLWEDFHAGLASEIRAQLTPRLRPRYVAVLTPRVAYDELVIEEARLAKPDVAVYDTATSAASASRSVAVAPAPVVATVQLEEPVREQSIEIRSTDAGELVTALEILSPVNKRPGHESFETYHRKRRDLLRTQVHLLEIDLLRAGRRTPRPVTPLPDSPYFVFLSRAERRSKLEVWPLTFRERLAIVPVPLLAPDVDVPLDLGEALDRLYDTAAYDLRIDYTKTPPPPALAPDDLRWLAECVASSAREK